MSKSRTLIESAIIAEVLLYKDAYTEIAHILRPESFCEGIEVPGYGIPLHRALWNCFDKMYPLEQINIITVTHKMKALYNINVFNSLDEITNVMYSAMNRQQHCFMLLELDLRKNFVKLLSGMKGDVAKNPSKEQDILEMISYAQSFANDIFSAIEEVYKYFGTQEYFWEESEKVKEFKDKIDMRIHDIKRAGHVKCLMTNLDSIYNFPSSKKAVIGCLVDLLKHAMVCGSLPEGLDTEIYKLRNKIVQ